MFHSLRQFLKTVTSFSDLSAMMRHQSCFLVVLALQLTCLGLVGSQTACLDVGTICANFAGSCSSSLYLNGVPIPRACPQTCNTCITTAMTTARPCGDMSTACLGITLRSCLDTSLTINGMSIPTYCPQTCRRCPATTTTTTPVTTSKASLTTELGE